MDAETRKAYLSTTDCNKCNEGREEHLRRLENDERLLSITVTRAYCEWTVLSPNQVTL